MRLQNPFVIFPPEFSTLSRYEIKRFALMHENELKMKQLGITTGQSFDERFLLGKRWSVTREIKRLEAKHAVEKHVSESTKKRLSKRVSARKTLKASPSFKSWREHVKYKPGNSGFKAAMENYEMTILENMSDAELLGLLTD